ncbi:MAG: restriction endonuclease fold toxin-2 domain-containing protein [Archangium sp.]
MPIQLWLRTLLFCLGLGLASPALAGSLERTICHTASAPVAVMATSEKLCRSFALGLDQVPGATAREAQALLTSENLATMGTLTALWIGSQGVPVVGESVDAALLTLGVVLLAAQSADLTLALWKYINLTTSAQSQADLQAASAHLARAIALVGVNVVTFLLMKKVSARLKNRPPPDEPSLLPATSPGAPEAPAPPRPAEASETAPAVHASGEMHPARASMKLLNPRAFADWIAKAPRRAVHAQKPPLKYQATKVGTEEILLKGGGEQIWVDGVRTSDAHLLEAKFVESPEVSPFVDGSQCNNEIRALIRDKELDQFRKYAALPRDPQTPAIGLEVITNDARAVPYFTRLMEELGIPGRVVVAP